MAINNFSEEDRKEVEALFAQLNEISTFRDRVLHRGAEMLPDGTLKSTNHATMKAIENLEVATFKLEDIEDATNDLNRISIRLTVFWGDNDENDLDPPFVAYLHAPWRYKPVQLETPHQPRLTKPPSRKRPRKSSAEK